MTKRLSQINEEIVHLVKRNTFQPIRYEHSTCRPYCLNLPFNFRGGGDCWEAIVHLVNSGGKIVHMDHFMFYASVYASLLTLFGAITILIPGCDR